VAKPGAGPGPGPGPEPGPGPGLGPGLGPGPGHAPTRRRCTGGRRNDGRCGAVRCKTGRDKAGRAARARAGRRETRRAVQGRRCSTAVAAGHADTRTHTATRTRSARGAGTAATPQWRGGAAQGGQASTVAHLACTLRGRCGGQHEQRLRHGQRQSTRSSHTAAGACAGRGELRSAERAARDTARGGADVRRAVQRRGGGAARDCVGGTAHGQVRAHTHAHAVRAVHAQRRMHRVGRRETGRGGARQGERCSAGHGRAALDTAGSGTLRGQHEQHERRARRAPAATAAPWQGQAHNAMALCAQAACHCRGEPRRAGAGGDGVCERAPGAGNRGQRRHPRTRTRACSSQTRAYIMWARGRGVEAMSGALTGTGAQR